MTSPYTVAMALFRKNIPESTGETGTPPATQTKTSELPRHFADMAKRPARPLTEMVKTHKAKHQTEPCNPMLSTPNRHSTDYIVEVRIREWQRRNKDLIDAKNAAAPKK